MLPLQITLRGLSGSAALETLIRKKAEKLTTFFNRITSCHVVIEQIQKHKHQGKVYNVRIDLLVPGKALVVTKKTDEDVYVALRDSFNALTRRLEEHSRKRHGRVKSHDHIMHGFIIRLVIKEGYGFIEGIDGNEYYFSLTNTSYPQFKQLSVGDAVEFVPDVTQDGLHALHVVRDKNHHYFSEAASW